MQTHISSHRRFIAAVIVGAFSASSLIAQFSFGVAAGESAPGVGEFWTRADSGGALILIVATDRDLSHPIAEISAMADEAHDQTVHARIDGLQPNMDYFYQFRSAADASMRSTVGRLRTAPAADAAAAVRFVFTGDSNYAFAPMAAMGVAAAENADTFIWFGDTIYSDVTAGGLGAARTLDDYRAKYRQMFGDAGVQAALAASTLLVGWDDHEVTNDYAGNDPALDRAQQQAGYSAFFEYMPIRAQGVADDPFRIYRRIRYGANAEFFMLDERQYRDVSAEEACGGNLDPLGALAGPLLRDPACADVLDSDRTMLGREQLEWLKASLLESTAPLKFVINNVPLSFIGIFPYDRWDGYDRERRELLEFIDANRINGVVLLTTDIHASAYNPNVMRYFRLHRPDYRLRNGVVVREVITGPIGNATARQSIAGIGESLLGGITSDPVESAVGESVAGSSAESPLLNGLVGYFENTLVSANDLDFIELNRLSYVVIDVDEQGGAALTWRGITPEQWSDFARNGAPAEAETIFEANIPRPSASGGGSAPAGIPCFIPFLLVLAGFVGTMRSGRGGAARRS